MRASLRWLPLLLLLACERAAHRAPRTTVSDAAILDCVGDWHNGAQVLKLWGDHPDYEPDYATAYRTDEPRVKSEELRYHVAANHLRLWRFRGREVSDAPFTLVRDETDTVYRYLLVLDAPVLGQRSFHGEMPSSYTCTPRAD